MLCFAQVFVSNGFPAGTTGYDFLTNIVSIVIIIATVAFVAFGAFAALNSAYCTHPHPTSVHADVFVPSVEPPVDASGSFL